MIDAGIDEDDIEVLDGDDEDTSVIKVDANSIVKLKKYLETKGIDLEEKLGGEIEEPEEDKDKKDAESADDGDEFEFDDSDLSDLFGDDVADEA